MVEYGVQHIPGLKFRLIIVLIVLHGSYHLTSFSLVQSILFYVDFDVGLVSG